MIFKYTVTNYHFYEPKALSESQYLGMKNRLQNDSKFSLMDKKENITNEFPFKNLVYRFFGGIGAIFIGRIIGGEGPDYGENIITNFGFLIMLAGGFSIIIAFFVLLFGLPSMFNFARYIKKKRRYYENLENSIRKSKNYDNFFDNFYK